MPSPAGPFELSEETPVYVISVAAHLSGLHPQTLRQYDRLGLVSPTRATGRGRRYSVRDIALLREVQRLSQDEGINLAGIKRIMELENEVAALRSHLAALQTDLDIALDELRRRQADRESSYHRAYLPDRLPSSPGSAVVVWRPGPRPH
ncbi:MAG: MerR family transcriptional regulator [Acidothermales bacterium]|jgi:MerR family transcriptional regulator/heat shock protein HspR|nr:MerR family transcriptional regulator [Acidothermales bacterium]